MSQKLTVALLAGNGGVQKGSAALLGRPAELSVLLGEVFAEGGGCVAAEVSLAKSGADNVENNSCFLDREKLCKLPDHENLDQLAQRVSVCSRSEAACGLLDDA